MASKKITINALMESIPEAETTEVNLEGGCFKDVTIRVRRTLPLEDALGFVHDIATLCTDDKTAEYSPELFDFAVRLHVLTYYANVDLTKDVKKAYRILYMTNIFQQVYTCVDSTQCSNLILSAERKIDHWKSLMESSVAGKVSEMLKKMEDVMVGSEQMMEAIDSDDFKAAVARLAEGGILGKAEMPIAPDEAHAEIPSPEAKQDTKGDTGNVVYLKKKK